MQPTDDERSTESRGVSGRRAVDDGARLIIAEDAIKRIDDKYAVLAGGQEVVSSVLLGAMHKDGTTTPGMVQSVKELRDKQDGIASDVAAVVADMGDLKTAQAEQAQTLAAHGTDLAEIKKWFALGVTYFKRAIDLAWKGVLGLIGVGLLHLLTLWWGAIAAFFSTWGPAASTAASAASKGHVH